MQPLMSDMWVMERSAKYEFEALRKARVTAIIGNGMRVDAETVRAASAAKSAVSQQKTIAIIPVHGAIEARPSEMGYWMGMTSYEAIGLAFDKAMMDDTISYIVFDVASPGGMVYGAPELADKIFRGRAIKPSIAVANPLAASGGYWIASAASRVVAIPSADVGSIGVLGEHEDDSQADEMEGIKMTYIVSTASPYKGEMCMPLTEDAKTNMQNRADAIYGQFAGDVARFRGVTIEQVMDKYGKGRVVAAKQALSAGMIDSIGTLQSTVMNLLSGRIKLGAERSQDNWNAPTQRELRESRMAAALAPPVINVEGE